MNKWEQRKGLEKAKSATDVRTEWERDYGRLVHSAAFRRLQSKTQVLGLGESDFYRTRLTHSMEVAQIGDGIVQWLKRNRHKEDEAIVAALPDSALINTICLAHDIGHPPFGHGGEVALNVCMRNHGGFEGNGQTLRILSKLDKYTENNGMNPTRRMLLGILKYPVSYTKTVVQEVYGPVPDPRWLCKAKQQHPPKCYLDDEQEIVDFILQPLTSEEKAEFTKFHKHANNGKKQHNKPKYKGLDTSIMELADDISYSLHDLEDAIALGMVSQRDWDEHFEQHKVFFSNCDLNYGEITQGLFGRSHMRKKAIGGLVHKLIISTHVTHSGVQGATTPLIKWNAIMQEAPKELMKSIKNLVFNKVIKSPNVQQLEFKGQKLVMELFAALESDPIRLLPSDYCKLYSDITNDDPKIQETAQKRLICDFIAGMTDEYATRFYEKLYYPHKGSIFDRL